MNIKDAQTLAITLMEKHNLTGWIFRWDNAKCRFGQCSHREKRISLSKRLTELNDEARVKNTILHEIAHALVDVRHGHDYVWRMKAQEIGCDGNRCYSRNDNHLSTVVVEGNYIAVCPNGHVHYKHKKPKRDSSCGLCFPRAFNRKYLLVFKPNK